MKFQIFALLFATHSLINCYEKSDFLKLDKCSSVKATNATDCYASSANSDEDNCCAISFMNKLMCKNFKKDSEVYKSFESFGGINAMKVYLTTNVIGKNSAEVRCTDNNTISADVKTLADNCGSLSTPSADKCGAMSNANVQCCYSTTTTKTFGKIEACAGVVAPIKMPSFTMNTNGENSSLMCGLNSDEQKMINGCSAVIPEAEADCAKLAKGDIECKYASYEKEGKRVKMCVGAKGDLEMMKNLEIEPRLRTVSFNQEKLELEGFERIRLSFAFCFFLIFFLF